MDENHQDKTESKLLATEDVRWGVNRKSKLWVPIHKKRTGFEGKTLWDWLQLLAVLAIPLILGLATLLFGIQQAHLADLQHQADQKLAQQQHEADQQNALDQQRATILQTYIDNIQDLMLTHNLLNSSTSDPTNKYYDVSILARARTLTALQGLDPIRKGLLVKFLYEAKLIGFTVITVNSLPKPLDPKIDLTDADLTRALLDGANLAGAHLAGVDLTNADIHVAHLEVADLTGARLYSADLTGAFLDGANLAGADLSSATLRYADLTDANLTWIDLAGADLTGTYLANIDLTDANLNRADLTATGLTQEQLDQVYSCLDAILPQGLTCHRTPDPNSFPITILS